MGKFYVFVQGFTCSCIGKKPQFYSVFVREVYGLPSKTITLTPIKPLSSRVYLKIFDGVHTTVFIEWPFSNSFDEGGILVDKTQELVQVQRVECRFVQVNMHSASGVSAYSGGK